MQSIRISVAAACSVPKMTARVVALAFSLSANWV